MASPGEEVVNSSTSTETELDRKMLCTPCDTDGKKLPAAGYCVTCKEFLCKTCFKYHRLPTATRKHILLDRTQMHDVSGSGKLCPEHDNRAVEYHCSTHELFGCHVCFFQHQKYCKDFRFIPKVAEDFQCTLEFKEFVENYEQVAKRTKKLSETAKQHLESVEKLAATEISAIKAYKVQVIDTIDRLEKELIGKVERLKETESLKLRDVLNKCTTIQKIVIDNANEIEVQQNMQQNEDLYITMVEANTKLVSLENGLRWFKKDVDAVQFKFKENGKLLQSLSKLSGLGIIENTGTISSAEHVTDVNIKIVNDTAECCIVGIALLPDKKLCVADCANMNIKLLDTRQNEVVATMTLANPPWAVAKVTDTCVAVSVPEEYTILLVNTDQTLRDHADKNLTVDREIVVESKCHGLAYSDGTLFVTCKEDKKVQLLDMQGLVLREIQTDKNGKRIFANPYTLAVNPERGHMYVVNGCGYHSVVCLKPDEKVIARYRDVELKGPQQVALDSSGMVFLVAYQSANVHLLTPECKKIRVLLDRDQVHNATALSYDHTRRLLYVGTGNHVSVFMIVYATPEA